jgi:heme-degrading monooxygenase HmoA
MLCDSGAGLAVVFGGGVPDFLCKAGHEDCNRLICAKNGCSYHILSFPSLEEPMAVKIIIVRRVPKEKQNEIRPLLLQMRAVANAQVGYVSGETLVNYDDPEENLVISTWKSLENWNQWLRNEQRIDLQSQVDRILGHETLYQIYYNG